jgi:hypothetical protein
MGRGARSGCKCAAPSYLFAMRSKFLSRCLLLLAFTVLMAIGCATKPKVDWNTRIGSYNFDQAVVELGPPDRQATLTDGKRVVEWVVGRTGGGGFSLGLGSFTGHTGVGVSQTVGTGMREKILRLTFNQNGQLLNWVKN